MTIGALALGDCDITDVDSDVSAEHARIWRSDQDGWLVKDLGSSNGTFVVDGANRIQNELQGDAVAALHAGDELHLGNSTVFAVVEGMPERWA